MPGILGPDPGRRRRATAAGSLPERAGYDLDASNFLDATRGRGEPLRSARLPECAGYGLDAFNFLDATRGHGEPLRAGLPECAGYGLDAFNFLGSSGGRGEAPLECSHGPGNPRPMPCPA